MGPKLNPKAETRLESRKKKKIRNSLTIQLKAKIYDEMGVAGHAYNSNLLLTLEREDKSEASPDNLRKPCFEPFFLITRVWGVV